MGQKTHPKGFRLVTNQKHLSDWYSNKFEYSNLLAEDYFIRLKIQEVFKEILSISKIDINRITQEDKAKEYVSIKIHALFPRAKEMSRKIIKYFGTSTDIKTNSKTDLETKELLGSKNFNSLANSKENLKTFTAFLLNHNVRNLIRFLQLKTKKNYFINFKFIKNPFEDPVLIAKFIADQLEKRTPFRRAVKQTIKKVKKTPMKGIKVQVSGRLNGVEIARSEWKRDGKIPLHTLRANIDYTHQFAQTIYGVIGIKVWLFAGNK